MGWRWFPLSSFAQLCVCEGHLGLTFALPTSPLAILAHLHSDVLPSDCINTIGKNDDKLPFLLAVLLQLIFLAFLDLLSF